MNVEQPRKPLLAGLEDGSVVMTAGDDRRIFSLEGVRLHRPRVGVRLRYCEEGSITLHDGRIAGGDLLVDGLNGIFAGRVKPGKFPVVTVYAETAKERVTAFGAIYFVNQTAERCRLALYDDEDPAQVAADARGGLGTDSGTIAIGELGDEDAAVSDEQMEEFQQRVEAGFENDASCQIVVGPRGENACMWRTGFGDGTYTPYWGLGRDGQPYFFAVDFGVVANGLYAPAVQMKTIGQSLELVPKG